MFCFFCFSLILFIFVLVSISLFFVYVVVGAVVVSVGGMFLFVTFFVLLAFLPVATIIQYKQDKNSDIFVPKSMMATSVA